LTLAACSASTGSARARLDLSNAPTDKDANCKQATVLPSRDLTRAEVESYWEADRVRLAACFGNVDALLAYIAQLKAGFDAAPRGKR
jgi:hypothetical protein